MQYNNLVINIQTYINLKKKKTINLSMIQFKILFNFNFNLFNYFYNDITIYK